MTTNIIFLRDMNMMTKDRRTMTIKQAPQGTMAQGDGLLGLHSMSSLTKTRSLGEDKPQTEASFQSADIALLAHSSRTVSSQASNSRFARFTLLVLLFLVGGMVSETWAAINVRWVVINHSGEKAIWYWANGNNVTDIPNTIKSPFAENYRVYKNLEDAEVDDGGTSYSGLTSGTLTDAGFSAGDAVYIRYSNNSTFDEYTNGQAHYLYVNSTSIENRYRLDPSSIGVFRQGNDYNALGNSCFWYFDGDDPYRLDLRNMLYPEKYFWREVESNKDVSQSSTRGRYFVVEYKNDGSTWTISALPTEAEYTAATNNNDSQFYVLNGGANRLALEYKKLDGRTGSGENITLNHPDVLYVVINKSEEIAIYDTKAQSAGTSPSIPSRIESPLVSAFYYWSDRACTQKMTSLPSANATVYVTYDIKPKAQWPININGEKKYNVIANASNRYYYAESAGSWLKTKVASDVTSSSLETTQDYLWSFEGGDPYNMTVFSSNSSKGQWDANYDGLGSKTETDTWRYLRTDKDPTSNAILTKFIITKASSSSPNTYQFVSTWHSFKQNIPMHVVSNNDNSWQYIQGSTSVLENHANSQFHIVDPFEVTVTYHVKKDASTERVKATVVESYNNKPSLPDVIKSPLATYTYYSDVSLTTPWGDADIASDGTSPVDIYVKYEYDSITDIDLSGSVNYNINVGDDNYIYSTSPSTFSYNDATTSSDKSTDSYKWNLYAGITIDPYQVTIKNKGEGTYIAYSTPSDDTNMTLSATGGNFFIREGANTDQYEFVAVTADDYGTEDFYTIGIANSSLKLFSSSNYTAGSNQVQTQIEALLFNYTYRVINKTTNDVSIQMTISGNPGLTPSLPAPITAAFTSGFSYFSEDGTTPMLTLPEADAVVIVKGYTVDASLDLTGTQQYYMQVGSAIKYAYDDSGSSIALNNSPSQTAEYRWTLVGEDPYHLNVRNQNTGTLLPGTFILTPGAATDQYELLEATGTTTLQYLGSSDNTSAAISSTWSHEDAENQVVFTIPSVTYTFVVVDLSNRKTLQSPSHTGQGGQALELDEFMRSPLVDDNAYYYYSTYDDTQSTSVLGLTGDLNGRLPYIDCTVYVRYQPNTSLLLDGSKTYVLKNGVSGVQKLVDVFYKVAGQYQSVTIHSDVVYRPEALQWKFYGREVSGIYDPYDVSIYNMIEGAYIVNDLGNGKDLGCNLGSYSRNGTPDRFMILNGKTDYFELMRRRCINDAYNTSASDLTTYAYVSANSSVLTTYHDASRHKSDGSQFSVGPVYVYHVLTLAGHDAVTAIEPRTVVAGTTRAELPDVISSPVISRYDYYDISAFTITDGVYKLKDSATPITYVSEATTSDIFAVYTRAYISDDFDFTGQKSYNMLFTSTYQLAASHQLQNKYGVVVDAWTPAEIESNSYDVTADKFLWQLQGSDPYALTIHNLDAGQISAPATASESDFSRFTYSSSNAINTFMLVGSGTNAYEYRLMPYRSSVSGSPYQYVGKSKKYNYGTNDYREIAVVGYAAYESYPEYFVSGDYVKLNLVRQRAADITYTVVNSTGTSLVSYTVDGTSGIAPLIPDRIKSPYAANFTYYNAATGGEVVSTTASGATIFVRYTTDPESMLDMSGTTSYNIAVNGNYINSSSLSGESSPADRTIDQYAWLVEGDPYQAKLKNKASGEYLTYGSTSGSSPITISFTEETPQTFVILPGTDSRHLELMATGQTASSNTALNVGRSDTDIKLYDQATYAHLSPQVSVVIRKIGSPLTWHIIDNAGREAISYTIVYPDDFPVLTYASIPDAIRSPYIEGETLTFYTSRSENAEPATDGRATYTLDGQITSIPAAGVPHIYVRYTNTALASKPLRLDGITGYDMNINNRYIYENNSALTAITTLDDFTDRSYMWHLSGQDPYAVQIQNVETSDYFLHAESPSAQLSLGTAQADSYFILMQYADWQTADEQARVELMAATGADLSEQPYYSVGRGSSGNPRLYDSNTYSSYTHGSHFLKVLLHVSLRDIYYHIVDRAGVVIATIPYSTGAAASLPDDWRSPMATNYRYWQASAFTGSGTTADPYVLTGGAEQTTNEASYADRHVYVTYDVLTNTNSADYVDMNTAVTDYTTRVTRSSSDATQVRDASKFGTMYMLKFLNGTDDYLENGSDVRESVLKTPVYPYTNGDGAIYVYDQTRWDDQAEAGASTRTRWPWYVLSPTNDPYHVLITSWQNSHANSGTNYYNFLRTYYNTTINQVVTTNISDDPRVTNTENTGGSADNVPTEYMLLGSKANGFKLRTTNEISDGTTSAHRTVDSFEQYWKNNPTVKDLAGDDPAANNSTLTTMGWHRYQAWANAVPFAGGSRVFEYTNHWYKTIDMGELFDLVPTEIDAVLVLLDNHGWEIMRHNIAKHRETAKYEADKAALRVYDSPMVSQYRFYGYRNAPKDAGYHKYTIEANTLVGAGASLADYPEKYSGGALYDLYVLYDVKPEYAHGYTAAATEGGSSATAYLVQQGTKYAKAADASATTISTVAKASIDITKFDNNNVTDNLLWYLQRNFNIDHEMGYAYSDDANGTLTQAETEAAYMASDVFSNGLDPYNLQLKNKATGHYFKLQHVSTATAVGSQWTATYTGDDMSVGLSQTLDNTLGTGHDNTTVRMTNATFMAIDDGHGNIRLMPRFDHQHVQTSFDYVANQLGAAVAGDDGTDATGGTQTTLFLLPNPYTYIIVDNKGREAVRFQSAGDVGPQMKEQFQSPLAKNFKFYKAASVSEGSYTFSNTDLITTFAGVTLTDNKVYVRYDYDPTLDVYGLLKAARATMQVGGTDVQYSSGIKSGTKDASAAVWQWQLAYDVTDIPDPYAVYVYNRSDLTKSMNVGTLGTDVVTANATGSRFVLLPFSGGTENDYALMVAGTQSEGSYPYYFLDGANISTGATTAQVTTYANSAALESKNKVHFNFDITPSTVTYKLITDGGKVALETTVTPSSPYKADMPDWMKTPLMTDNAYIYCTKATGSDAAGWIVNEDSWTQTLLNLEAGNTVYVRYHYADSKTAVGHSANRASNKSVIDLSGTVPYYLQMHVWTWYDPSDSKVSLSQSEDAYYNTNETARWLLKGNDPYAITIVNPSFGNTKVLSSATPVSGERVFATMQDLSAEGYPNQTFMILKGGTNYIYAYVTGSQTLRLTEKGTEGLQLYNDTKQYSAYENKNQIHDNQPYASFKFYPMVRYHVITNSNVEAINALSPLPATTVNLDAYKTPLLPSNAYSYYTEAPTMEADVLTTHGTKIAEGTTLAEMARQLITDIYVRYAAYDRTTSPLQYPDGVGSEKYQGLDLSGNTWYNMGRFMEHAITSDNPSYYPPGGDTSPNSWYDWSNVIYLNGNNLTTTALSGENGKSTTPGLSSKQMVWRFVGDDPYAIRIYNASQGNLPLTATNGSQNIAFAETGDCQTFMMLKGRGQDDRNIRWANDSKTELLDCNLFMLTGTTGRYLNVRDSKVYNYFFHYWTGQWSMNTNLGNGSGGTQGGWVYFYKAPTARRYHYFAVNQEKGEVTWDAILEYDWFADIELDNNISRLYTKYEEKYLGVDGKTANVFKTREELNDVAQFYSDAALTTRVSYEDADAGTTLYDIYPDFNDEEYPNGYPIYFKYQPMTNSDIEDLTGDDKTDFRWTTSGQIAGDVTYYKANGQLDEKHLTNDVHANWFFMVLDTDEGITATGAGTDRKFTGNQYFLRREDTGSIGWMNSVRTLHHENEDNLNGYSYSRLAESTRDSEHTPFREARWLWTFVGNDPYDVKLINFESALGIDAEYEDDKMAGAANCYTRFNTVTTTDAKTGVTTTTYPVSIPTSEPATADKPYCQWGLTNGYGTEKTFSLLSTYPTTTVDGLTVNQKLYWQMTADSVSLQPRASLRQNAMQLLPYVPTKYEDVNLVIRRDDEVATYKTTYTTALADVTGDAKTAQLNYLNNTMKTGISRMFFAAEDRMFVAGDKITADNIPVEVKRQFCTYITYSDDYRTQGDAAIAEGPYRYKQTGYNADNEPVYNYKYNITDEDETPVTLPQSFYVKYHVNSDIFLTEDALPQVEYNADGTVKSEFESNYTALKTEVARMANENDHVYFLDFTDNLSQEGYNLGYHAYFDEEGSMKSQLPKEWTDERKVERKVWSTTEGNYVDATGDIYTDANGVKIDPLYNQWQYQTTSNRMTSVPEKLKWYFVGDPYNVQVFCTKLPGYNLARFNEEESHFQFIADCVHLRASDNVNNIDKRIEVPEYKAGLGEGGAPVATGKTMRNPNYNKPVYGSFYWEMVPAATTREGTFALRFRASNTVLGLEKVYYYLTHDGTQRSYYNASAGTAEKFNVNLNYDKNNTYSNAYEGLHKANNAQAAIHLVQPAKVYVTAYPKGTTTPKVIDELTEYFGVGETLNDVPRHLKRKYTTYSNLRYIPKGGKTLSNTSDYNGSGGTQEIFPLKLTTEKAYNYNNCTEHPVGDTTTPNYDKVFVSGASTNADFRLWVDYELDSDGKRLFTTAENATAGDYTWNDLLVKDWQGDKESEPGRVATTWMYYDKTKYDAKTTAHSDLGQWRITSFNDASLSSSGNGWNTGVKGLHWAFVGDAYSFKMVNRRQLDNKGNACYDESIKCPYVGTSNANGTAFKAHSTMSAGGNYSYPVGGQRIEDTGFRAIPYSAYLRMQEDDTQGTNLTTGNGNTDWGFVYCKTGGDDQVLLRTASLKKTIGDYSNEFTPANDYTNPSVAAKLYDSGNSESYNHTNNFHYVEWQRGHYKETDAGGAGSVNPENSNDVVIADFLLTPFTLSTPTNYIDQMQPATANMPDGDPGLNDCFDADVFVCDINGIQKARKLKAELRYTDSANGITVADVLPQSLKRYGCSYRAYINYGTATQKEITEFSDATLAEATVTEAGTDCLKDITYIYTVDDEVAQFFTSADDARNDEYTWASGYYRWDRTITGKVQYYVTETYIADYVYNAAGRVEGYIYGEREVPKWSDGSSTTVTSNGWLNTHNGADQAFGDDHQQNDNDNDQKWAYVGDPYSFTLQNYTKYLQNPTSALYYNNSTGSVYFSLTQSSNWTLALDSNGKYYLALIDSDGNILSYSTFDRGDNTDLTADKQYLYTNGGLPDDDPTGNLLGLNGRVKPFYLANLNSFAAFVIYHLVTAHQHAADYEDDNTSLDSDGRRKVRQLMAEYLKYHAKDKYDDYCEKSDTKVFDYLDSLCIGDPKGYVLDDFKSTYIDANGKVTGDALTYLTSENSVLHQASLRDVVSYPISNYIVTKVPLGNVLNVPWYMKRQFCKYTLRQRDVLRSATNYSDPITVIKDGVTCYVWMNDELGVADTLATSQSKDSPWYKVCNVNWESVTLYTGSNEDTQKDKVTIAAENGNIITKLNKTHQNRMVLVDVVYEVDPEQFKFAVKGRNTTRWYSMMTNNVQDGLMNFSYKAGIGARPDRTQHYTNNYLWAPEGDPYGFILHNRYATLNGSGWDNIVVSTTSRLPDAETVADKSLKAGEIEKVEFPANSERMTYAEAEALGESTVTYNGAAAVDQAVYTGQKSLVQFNQRRITHPGRDETTGRRSWAPTNAVYEMFVGNYAQAFLMHPTSAYVNTSGDKFGSFYMVHKPQTATSQLEYSADVSMLRSAPDANWRLITTPEQLLPYFEHSGYVGGLNTTVANRSQNRSYYGKLLEFQSAWANNSRDLSRLPSDYFTVTDAIRDVVYGGKFYARKTDGSYESSEFTYNTPRPKDNTASGGTDDRYKLPLKFVPDNLIPMQQGYYRLVAFSQKGLDADAENAFGTGVHGIQGPRYISGYRHESEMTKAGYNSSGTLEDGARWLHFYETDESHTTTYKTFGDLNAKIGSADAYHDRSITPHPAMRGNIEILPAEYDPSSIFYFTPVSGDGYDRYNFGTQGLRVRGRAGGVQNGDKYGTQIPVDATNYGMTKLVAPDATAEAGFDDKFRLQDIGGAAVTLRLLKNEPTGSNWDEIVGDNLKNNSLCIDANHRYRVTIHTNNEMMEIGDTYDATAGHWTGLGIQDTKWLLQPVGTKTQWPYNEVPLRLEVQKGEQKSGTDSEGNPVYNYYASLYVPFDTRLSNTTDVAFTLDTAPKAVGDVTPDASGNRSQSMTLRSLALLNNMGNPQFIPGGWPVVIRSSSPKASTINSVNGKPETRHYVELYLPNVEPTSIPESKAKIDDAGLRGSYLERSLTSADISDLPSTVPSTQETALSASSTVMVFGQPFVEGEGDAPTAKGETTVAWYTHTNDAPGFCTNENWWRGHYGTTQVNATTNDGTLSTAFLANNHGDDTATKLQRSNTYVYHNKVFLIYAASTVDAPRYVRTRFGDEEDNDEDDDRNIEEGVTNKAPWPCDVYDLQGRKVATNETPSTLLQNHPSLSKGVYIFGGRKVIVK